MIKTIISLPPISCILSRNTTVTEQLTPLQKDDCSRGRAVGFAGGWSEVGMVCGGFPRANWSSPFSYRSRKKMLDLPGSPQAENFHIPPHFGSDRLPKSKHPLILRSSTCVLSPYLSPPSVVNSSQLPSVSLRSRPPFAGHRSPRGNQVYRLRQSYSPLSAALTSRVPFTAHLSPPSMGKPRPPSVALSSRTLMCPWACWWRMSWSWSPLLNSAPQSTPKFPCFQNAPKCMRFQSTLKCLLLASPLQCPLLTNPLQCPLLASPLQCPLLTSAHSSVAPTRARSLPNKCVFERGGGAICPWP